jgi:hypothetical protein
MVEQTKSLIVDSFACAIPAFGEPPVRICRDIARAAADGPLTVIGTTPRTTPDLAGFANGAAIRYYDLNDAYASPTSGAVHPSDHIGACLALAEAEKASAADAITAIVLAGVCRTHRPGADLREPQGLLPAGGDTDGRGRRCLRRTQRAFPDSRLRREDLSRRRLLQTAIAAGIELAKEIGRVDRITSLEIATTARSYEQSGRDRKKWTPQIRDTADRSLPCLTARALFDGDIAQEDLRLGADMRSRDPHAHAKDRREGGSCLRQAEGQCTGDPSHRDPGRRPYRHAAGRRHAGLSRPADEPGRDGSQVPQQCRRALAGEPCRCALAGAVELRAD